MRRTMIFPMVALMGAALACSDRSPTSPALGSTAASSASTDEAALQMAARTRKVIIVPARSDNSLPPGVWGSDQASLTIREGSATLEILSLALPTGGCFGQLGDMGRSIPNGSFSIAGTFTQLIGAFPGRIVSAAQYSGMVSGNTLTISVSVPAAQQSLGPYVLVQGVANSWTQCLYP
jgi:hypothetical protein